MISIEGKNSVNTLVFERTSAYYPSRDRDQRLDRGVRSVGNTGE